VHDAADLHRARPRLVAFENTHNRCGGRIHDQAVLDDCAVRARDCGLAVHLDGARLFNASVASGRPLAELAAQVDSVSLCFSKGLGAPVGSVLAGSDEFIARARFFRKQWGGGMRQAGILAAACVHALDHHVDRLAEDHRHAGELAEGIDHPGWVLRAAPDTNIVLWDLEGEHDAGWFERDLAESGILLSSFGARTVRMVTHLGVSTADIERTIETVNARGSRAIAGGNR
jgi:threonine aldolase